MAGAGEPLGHGAGVRGQIPGDPFGPVQGRNQDGPRLFPERKMGQTEDIREWLGPDGLGGFASGAVTGPRPRRYHALLLSAATPPTGRFVLVNGFDAWVEEGGK